MFTPKKWSGPKKIVSPKKDFVRKKSGPKRNFWFEINLWSEEAKKLGQNKIWDPNFSSYPSQINKELTLFPANRKNQNF